MADGIETKPAKSDWRTIGLGGITLGLLAGGIEALSAGIASYTAPAVTTGGLATAGSLTSTGIGVTTATGGLATAGGITTTGILSTAGAGFTFATVGWLALGAAAVAAAIYVGNKTYHAYKDRQAEKSAIAAERNADIERAGILAQQQPQLTVTVEQTSPQTVETTQAFAQENAVDTKWRQRQQNEAVSVTQGNIR